MYRLAPYARKETLVAALSSLLGSAAGLAVVFLDGRSEGWALVAVFPLFLGFSLFFFRDPDRQPPAAEPGLVAPADGRVTDITEVDEPEFLGGKALRVGIFMSLFDVHVNRSPARATLKKSVHRNGAFGNVMFEKNWTKNENVLLGFDGEEGPIAVRLVAGAVARRIVLAHGEGDPVERGQRLGMVKYGSRGEVMVPLGSGWTPKVAVGQHVTAGESVVFSRSEEGAPKSDEVSSS